MVNLHPLHRGGAAQPRHEQHRGEGGGALAQARTLAFESVLLSFFKKFDCEKRI